MNFFPNISSYKDMMLNLSGKFNYIKLKAPTDAYGASWDAYTDWGAWDFNHDSIWFK